MMISSTFSVRRPVETLFASEEAAAIERILDDVAAVVENAADADRHVREALFDAFITGDDRAWRGVYRILAAVVAHPRTAGTPALRRLASFLAENADLAVPADD